MDSLSFPLVLGWTAFFAVAIVAMILAVVLLLGLVHWMLPAGKLRVAIELVLALLGLAIAATLGNW